MVVKAVREVGETASRPRICQQGVGRRQQLPSNITVREGERAGIVEGGRGRGRRGPGGEEEGQ